MSAFVLAKSLHAFVVPFALGELALFALQVLSPLLCVALRLVTFVLKFLAGKQHTHGAVMQQHGRLLAL